MSATPSPTSIGAAAKVDTADAAQELAAYVSLVTGRAKSELAGFAQQYGAQYAAAAAALAVAKLSGDAIAIARAETDIDVLNDDALLDAAMSTIDDESDGESVALKVLNQFVGLLVSRILA